MSGTGSVHQYGLDTSAQVAALAALAHGIRDAPAADLPHWASAQASLILGADVTLRPTPVLIPAPTTPDDAADSEATVSLTVPLVVDGHLWGDLRARRRARDFAADFAAHDLACADIIAVLVVNALERVALLRNSNRDPVTGLANRQALDDAAGALLARVTLGSARRVTAVSVGTGDRGQVAEVATLLVRYFSALNGSLVARVGETDFTVLVADHPVADVAAAADAFSAEAAASPTAPDVYCGLASTTGTQPWETSGHLLAAARKACARARLERGINPPVRELTTTSAPGPGA